MGALRIDIFSGEDELSDDIVSHPYLAAIYAKNEVDKILKNNTSYSVYCTNNSDFVSTVFYYTSFNRFPIELRLHLNGVQVDSLDRLFEDWNRSLDFINQITEI